MRCVVLMILVFSQVAKADFFKKDDLESAAGLQYRSLLYKRGIITYEGYQIVPIYSVTLFNPNLLLAGSSLFYKVSLAEKFLFRTRISIDSTEDNPLYFTDEREEDRVRREETSEWDLYLEYLSDPGHYLRFNLSQDLYAHNGTYLELRGRVALVDFLNRGGEPLIQPALFTAVGSGTANHNEYFYGEGADHAGLNNIEYGIVVTSPKVIDVFWPTLKLTRFEILGDKNRNGSFVQEKEGFSFELLSAFKIW